MNNHESIVVAVSPFYSGLGWKDEATGLLFRPSDRLSAVRISKDRDLSGIKNAVRLNHLLVLEGKLDTEGPIEKEALDPNLLTKEQFQTMLHQMKEQAAPDEEEIRQLKEENTALKAAKKALEDELALLTEKAEEPAPEEEAPEEPAALWTEEELLKLTKAELLSLAEEKNIAYKETDTKAVLAANLAGTAK